MFSVSNKALFSFKLFELFDSYLYCVNNNCTLLKMKCIILWFKTKHWDSMMYVPNWPSEFILKNLHLLFQ